MSINAKFLFLSFRSIEIREESEVISRMFDWLETQIVLTGETRKRSHETHRLRQRMRQIWVYCSIQSSLEPIPRRTFATVSCWDILGLNAAGVNRKLCLKRDCCKNREYCFLVNSANLCTFLVIVERAYVNRRFTREKTIPGITLFSWRVSSSDEFPSLKVFFVV